MPVIGTVTREQIYSAMFALAAASSTFLTKSRLLLPWSAVPAEQQPALFQTQTGETPVSSPSHIGMPYKWTLGVKFWLYSNRGADDTTVPSTAMNPLVDALVAAIRNPVVGEKQTLNGLVYDVRFAGKIATDEGMLGSQAVSVIPVEIFTGEL